MNKIIITAAITGSIHIPTQSEYLPITPDQIVEDAVKSHGAGAAIAHIHVRDPDSGKPTADPDLFEEVHVKIKKRCDLILLPTTGGGPNQSVPCSDSMARSAMQRPRPAARWERVVKNGCRAPASTSGASATPSLVTQRM